MKKPLNIKKFLLPNIPYVFIALFATKLGQAWRLAPGMDFSGKALHLMEGFAAAFQSALPSFHPHRPVRGRCSRSAHLAYRVRQGQKR